MNPTMEFVKTTSNLLLQKSERQKPDNKTLSEHAKKVYNNRKVIALKSQHIDSYMHIADEMDKKSSSSTWKQVIDLIASKLPI